MHSSSQAVWLEQCRIWYARRRPAVLRGPLRHGRERNSLQPASRVLIPASARASIPASADYSARLGRRLSARLGRRRSARLGLESGLAWPGSSLTGKVRGAGAAVHRPGRGVARFGVSRGMRAVLIGPTWRRLARCRRGVAVTESDGGNVACQPSPSKPVHCLSQRPGPGTEPGRSLVIRGAECASCTKSGPVY